MPSLNKGEMALLEGILESLAPLGSVEVSAFSIYPELDKKRFPSSVKLIDICKELHIGRYIRGGTLNAELLASFLSGIQHLFFVFLLRILGKNSLRMMKGTLWREYCESGGLYPLYERR